MKLKSYRHLNKLYLKHLRHNCCDFADINWKYNNILGLGKLQPGEKQDPMPFLDF